MIIETHCGLHLGDNLVHLLFLRGVAKQYPKTRIRHACQRQYLIQLLPLVTDLPNIYLLPIDEVGPIGENAWRGADGFWYCHPERNDFVKSNRDWFEHLAHKLGVLNPIQSAEDFLWDAVALKAQPKVLADILFINSAPLSGQFAGYHAESLSDVARRIAATGRSIITTSPVPGVSCTQQFGMSVADIGALSVFSEAVVGVATGPIWTTFTKQNTHAQRVILLDQERLNITPKTVHASTMADFEAALLRAGLLT